MVSAIKTTRNLIGGAVGALLGWLIVEPIPQLTTDPRVGQPSEPLSMVALAALGMIVGACMGLGLGTAEGINSGSARQVGRSMLLGALIGAAGGLVGIYLGQMVYGGIVGQPSGPLDLVAFLRNLIARTLGWALWGVIIGAAQGILTGSLRRISLGAVGGVIGGAIGGFVFEVLGGVAGAMMTGEVLRLVGFVSVGTGIGLFSSLAQELFKQAWVRVLVGRGEGREFQIAKPVTVLGRDELADIPLFGDPQIARQHAVIHQAPGGHRIEAAAPGLMLSVNSQTVSAASLSDGDRIRIASREIEFHEKASRGRASIPVAAPPSVPRPEAAPVEVASGVCQFCGQSKDSFGNCACTVGSPQVVENAAGGQPEASQASEPTVLGGGPAAPAMTWLTLDVIGGPLTGKSYQVAEGQSLSIGRGDDNDLVLADDAFASRRHASVSILTGEPVIEDKGSANGTLVNGKRVQRQMIRKGDIIAIGQTQFRVA